MTYSTGTTLWAVAATYLLYRLLQVDILSPRRCRSPSLIAMFGSFGGPTSQASQPFIARYTNLALKWQAVAGQRTKYIHVLHQQLICALTALTSLIPLLTHHRSNGPYQSEWSRRRRHRPFPHRPQHKRQLPQGRRVHGACSLPDR